MYGRVAALADRLAAWMGAVGLPSATLVGNPIGCQVVVECAARQANRVHAVVLAAPTVDPRAATFPRQLGRPAAAPGALPSPDQGGRAWRHRSSAARRRRCA
jgi:pimeloyl-ACP methyl ester carboxylesterase